MVGGHQRRPHVSPPCSPTSWPRFCVLGLAQAPGLCELPIWPWAPLRELVGGAPQLLAVGGVPWGFVPLCCGSQCAPWLPSSAEGQACCPFGRSVVWLRAELPPAAPAYPHPPSPRPPPWGPTPFQASRLACSRAEHTDRCPVAPFLPPRPSALLSRACCPKADALPLAKKKGNLAPDSVLASRQDQCSLQDGCHPGMPSGSLPWSLTQCDVAVSEQTGRVCRFLGSGQCLCSCLLKGRA